MSEEAKPEESPIFAALEKDELPLLTAALAANPNVNILDENHMSPLQHAAYKGNKEIVQMLLDHGADPNFCQHKHNYTTLHFAALSGNSEVCLALLNAGAKSDKLNAVNRTPAQMAAFVGHHKCVAVINNFIKKTVTDYYTVAHGAQNEPLLAPFLADSFHKLIIQPDSHPVKIALNVCNFIGIVDHLEKVKKVLELMCEKEIKKEGNNSETNAFKFHYMSQVIDELMNIKKRTISEPEKKVDVLQVFCKSILKPDKDGFLGFLDGWLKECIKKFPYHESALFRQMVSSLTSQDPPTALSIVSASISGQRGFIDSEAVCATCGEEKPAKKCSQCKVVQYCDKNCQKLHWSWHKKECASLAKKTA